jgi:hypothetical protein
MSLNYNFLPKLLYNNGSIINIKDAWFLSLARDAYKFAFQVPIKKCVWGYGWRFTADENPFYHVYNDHHNLDKFYQNYQPISALEALTFEPSDGGWNSLTLPWRCQIDCVDSNAIKLCHNQLSSQVGPLSSNRLELEKNKLKQVFTSIQTGDYQLKNGIYSPIWGYFMIHDNDFVFHVTAGKHEAAALSKLGYTSLPVTFNIFVPRMPRLISYQHLELLSQVAYPATVMPTVYEIFESYFDNTLRQRRISYLADWMKRA